MTFYELVRSSLLLDSNENQPPGSLAQTVLDSFYSKYMGTTYQQPCTYNLSNPLNDSNEQIRND